MFNSFLSTFTISNSQIVNITNSIQISSSNLTIVNTQISNAANNAITDLIFVSLGSIIEIDYSSFSNSTSSLLNTRNSQVKINFLNLSNINSPSKLIQIANSDNLVITGLDIFNWTSSDLVLLYFDSTKNINLSKFSVSQANSWLVQIKNSIVNQINSFSIDKVLQPFVIISSSIGGILNSNFTDNGGKYLRAGGAILMTNSKVTISNSQFINNSAISGGAISFEWTNLVSWNLTISNSTFDSNYGISQGGAIYYDYNRPVINDLVFKNNYAEYGLNFASYAVQIKMVGNLSDKMIIDNMVSGVQYDKVVKLSLIDYDNQTMILNNVNQIVINPLNKTFVSMKGTNTALLRSGIASFNNLIINTKPGSQNIQNQASSKSIDSLKIKEVYGVVGSNIIYSNFRFCKPGEIELTDNTCSIWAPGTYSLEWNSTVCSSCPSNAEWLGGNQIFVDSGYWRRFSNTSTVVPWINSKAWNGGFVDQENAPVSWQTGYTGILCDEWDISNGVKYSKVSDYECQKWPSPVINAIRVIGLILLVFVFIWILVIVNIRKTKESQMSVLLRILTNYLQLISSMMSFNIKYPSTLSDLFLPFSEIGSSSEVFLSFDCFVTDYDIKGPFPTNKIFKVFLSALLPLILLSLFAAIWILVKLVSNRLVPDLQRNIVISFISILFLLHPRMVQNSFLMFEWVSIDSGISRSKVDLNETCFSSNHVKWIFAIAFPILLVWVILTPLAALYLLFRNYKKDENNKVKQYFLILYQGLRQEAFYWEFVNTLRKALILMIFSILSFLNISLKILISSLVLFSSMRIQGKLKPYKLDENNAIELRALIASIFTMITGIMFVQDSQIGFISVTIFLFVIAINMWFILEWLYLFCICMPYKFFKTVISKLIAIAR